MPDPATPAVTRRGRGKALGNRLVYLMGASGSGKDSLLRAARERLDGEPGIVFGHRYITRPAAGGGENHVELSAAEFALRQDAGCFALAWESHGLAYGIGREIDLWLEAGLVVIINGSRAHLAGARRRYPDMHPVLVRVPREILRRRLEARSRESGDELDERLAGTASLDAAVTNAVSIDNSGDLAEAADTLVAVLRGIRSRAGR